MFKMTKQYLLEFNRQFFQKSKSISSLFLTSNFPKGVPLWWRLEICLISCVFSRNTSRNKEVKVNKLIYFQSTLWVIIKSLQSYFGSIFQNKASSSFKIRKSFSSIWSPIYWFVINVKEWFPMLSYYSVFHESGLESKYRNTQRVVYERTRKWPFRCKNAILIKSQ